MVITLNGIKKVYETDTVETTALKSVDLQVEPGEFLAVMGPSGCGKSTLLNILGTLDNPSEGTYALAGETVTGQSDKALAAVRRRHIGFVFQSFNLLDNLSVRENVELALLYRKVGTAERRDRVAAVLERVRMAHRADHRPGQLSGGQQQRVAVARALVSEPSLILADEPTGNLDSHNGVEVMETLEALNQEGATIVMVTHSPEHAAHAGRLIRLHDGAILSDERRN
ncbi:MAG: ABC transporter ATP-binding protein [Myxococcota bacterium]